MGEAGEGEAVDDGLDDAVDLREGLVVGAPFEVGDDGVGAEDRHSGAGDGAKEIERIRGGLAVAEGDLPAIEVVDGDGCRSELGALCGDLSRGKRCFWDYLTKSEQLRQPQAALDDRAGDPASVPNVAVGAGGRSMGMRVSVSFVYEGEESVALYAHNGGIDFVEEAYDYARELLGRLGSVRGGPLSRLEPSHVIVDFIRWFALPLGGDASKELDCYLGKDRLDGDNTDFGHYAIHLDWDLNEQWDEIAERAGR